jgi:hypothetical protein
MVNDESNPSDAAVHRQFAAVVRTLQFIVLGVTLGPLIFLVLVVFVIEPPAGPVGQLGSLTLTHIALGFAAIAVVAWVVVPRAIVAARRRQLIEQTSTSNAQVGQRGAARGGASPDEIAALAQLYNVNMVRTIMGVALLEGAAFFLLVVYLLERRPPALVAAAALIAAIALHMPTPSRVARWVERQLDRLEQDRQIKQLRGEA